MLLFRKEGLSIVCKDTTPVKYKVAFVTGLPNWHFPELFRKMAQHPRLDLTMLFCTTLDRLFLKQTFGIEKESFGVDLLQGYKYKFLRNYSPIKPKFNKTRLFSCLNFGILREIKKGGYDAVIITMWNDVVYWLAALACKALQIPFFFAGDSTILTEQVKPKWKKRIKRLLLGKVLFPMAHGFLYRTEANRLFYLYHGVIKERLFQFPLSVDVESLSALACKLKRERDNLRVKYGLSPEAFVILFVGRLSKEKRPLDLLSAYVKVSIGVEKNLIFVGDGPLKNYLRHQVKKMRLKKVYFMGFKPKPEIYNFYALADILVLPSDYETHGDVVKEAMCFNLPVIVSNKVGASYDLIKHGENGFVYPCGDIDTLAHYISKLSEEQKRRNMGQKARDIIKEWDHKIAINSLLNVLDTIYGRRAHV